MYIPDYQHNKSCMVVKIHHSLGDGVSMAMTITAASDNFNPKDVFTSLRQISCLQWTIIYLFIPFFVLRQNFILFTTPRDYNCMFQSVKNTGIKKGAFSTDLDLLKIKAYCKQNKFTVNHYYFGILSKTLHDYMSL